jgi:beta-N-acetylhexosaminidase
MTDADLAGAVLMPSFEKKVKPETFGKLLCSIHARSYVILRSDTSKKLVDAVQAAYTRACPQRPLKLAVALDAEPSLMKYRMPSVATPETSALHTEEESVATATKIARALHDAGIFINFAPVYDLDFNAAIINTRSFSKDPDTVIRHADAFARATWQSGVIPTAKHFPGHGMVSGDSHKELVRIYGSPAEIPEFVAAIRHGVPMMMVGHIAVDDKQWGTGGLPATLSPKIMRTLLRDELGFKGVVVTDSMAMGALKGYADRTVKALTAGADIVLIPPDPKAAFTRVAVHMKEDTAFAARVRDAARRFLTIQVVRDQLEQTQ